jgi:hypothetical protein
MEDFFAAPGQQAYRPVHYRFDYGRGHVYVM